MAKKRKKKPKYRLKENAKRFLIYFGVCSLIILYAIIGLSKRIKEYEYTQTNEYKLQVLGYTENQTKNIVNNIDDKYITAILEEDEVINFYYELAGNKYYIKNNYEKYLEYYEYHKTTETKDIVSIINTGSNQEWYTNTKKANTNKNPILIDKFTYLNEDYKPDNLVNINLQTAYSGHKATEETVNAYYEMHAAIKEELGSILMVNASYRSYKDQQTRYNQYKMTSVEFANTYCERAGHSEHQLGIALDLVSKYKTEITEEEYEWLKNNSYKYGFIIRYPKDKYKITKHIEDNHFTYVGKTIAKVIHDENITLDEYYAYYIAQ